MNRQTLILDTSLLILLVVGLTSRDYVTKHKRLRSFEPEDFDLLEGIIGSAGTLLLTPNTVTEASNFLRHIEDPARSEIMQVFAAFIGASDTREVYVESKRAAESMPFIRMGVTDTVMLLTLKDSHTLITADAELWAEELSAGGRAENFHHLRGLDA